MAYESLRDNVDDCDAAFLLTPLLDQYDLDSFTDGVQSQIQDLNEDSLNELASDVSEA